MTIFGNGIQSDHRWVGHNAFLYLARSQANRFMPIFGNVYALSGTIICFLARSEGLPLLLPAFVGPIRRIALIIACVCLSVCVSVCVCVCVSVCRPPF